MSSGWGLFCIPTPNPAAYSRKASGALPGLRWPADILVGRWSAHQYSLTTIAGRPPSRCGRSRCWLRRCPRFRCSVRTGRPISRSAPITSVRTRRRNVLRVARAKPAESDDSGHALSVGGEAAIGTGVPAVIGAPWIVLGIGLCAAPRDRGENRRKEEECLHAHKLVGPPCIENPGPACRSSTESNFPRPFRFCSFAAPDPATATGQKGLLD